MLIWRLTLHLEFAKEAMMCQSLDQGEVLDIKWAHDDPNPVAQDAIDRADRDALYALMQAKGIHSVFHIRLTYEQESV